MSFFRRKSNSTNDTDDRHDDNDSKEEALKEQVGDLQVEMKRLNKRLFEMQIKVQSSATIATPISSLPRVYANTQIDRSSLLRHNPSLTNQPLQNSKELEDILATNEINFVPNEMLYNGKEDKDRPKLRLSTIFSRNSKPSPHITEISKRKKEESKRLFMGRNSVNNDGDLFHVIDQMAVFEDQKKNGSRSNFVGDGGSDTTNQRSTVTTKNGRKIRRVIRKVRAAPTLVPIEVVSPTPLSLLPPSPTTITITPKPTIPICGGRGDLLSSNAYNVLHVAETIQTNNLSRIQLSGSNEVHVPIDAKSTGNSGRIGNQIMIDAASRQKTTIPFTLGINPDRHQEKDNEPIFTPIKSPNGQLDQFCRTKVEKLGTEMDFPCNPNQIGKYQLDTASFSSNAKPNTSTELIYERGVQYENNQENENKSGITTQSNSIGNAFTSMVAKSSELKQAENAMKTHNPTSDFFKDIRTGIKLKQVQRSLSQHTIPANDPTNDLLATIRVGVKLKKVQRSTLLPPKKKETPLSALLATIRVGVKLKQVQKSTLLPPMKKETPMSALLAKIKERKGECMRRDREDDSLSIEQSEIDW